MCEPPWRTELVQIRKDEEIRYIAPIFTWFQQWRIRRGVWSLLPQSEFNLSKEMRDRVNSHLVLTLANLLHSRVYLPVHGIHHASLISNWHHLLCTFHNGFSCIISIQEYLSQNRHFLGQSVIAAIQCGVSWGLGLKGKSGS